MFCNIKETDNNNKYITHIGSHFSLGSTARLKLFVINRILAISANPNISQIFFQPSVFFSDSRLGVYFELGMSPVYF